MNLETSKFIRKNLKRLQEEKIQKIVEELTQMEKQAPKKYHLDISTVETLEDIKAILSGMDLAINDNDPKFHLFKKYFTIEKT